MNRFHHIQIVACSVTMLVLPAAHAATISIQAYAQSAGRLVDINRTGQLPDSASATAENAATDSFASRAVSVARSGAGVVGASANSTALASGVPAGAVAWAVARLEDQFMFDVSDGATGVRYWFDVSFLVSGGLSAYAARQAPPNSTAGANANFEAWLRLSSATANCCGPEWVRGGKGRSVSVSEQAGIQELDYVPPGTQAREPGIWTASMSAIDGELISLDMYLRTAADAQTTNLGLAEASSGFSHTAAWGGIHNVRLADGTLVSAAVSALSSDGFDYARSAVVNTVDEPNSLWLVALSLAAAGIGGSRFPGRCSLRTFAANIPSQRRHAG